MKNNKKRKKPQLQDPRMKIVGLGKSKKRNSGSIDHDKILYEK
jgi:hypothetical protein